MLMYNKTKKTEKEVIILDDKSQQSNVIQFTDIQKQAQGDQNVEQHANTEDQANGQVQNAAPIEDAMPSQSANSQAGENPAEDTSAAAPQDSSQEEEDFNKRWLPEPLKEFRNKQFFGAALLAVGAIVVTLAFKNYGGLVLLLGTAYYAYNGLNISRKYYTGQIKEVTAICSGMRAATIKERTLVTFREEHEDGHFAYHKFFVPGKNAEDDFIINAPYVIYYDLANPNVLVGSIVI